MSLDIVQTFTAVLERFDGAGTWTYVRVPAQVTSTLSNRTCTAVRGTLNGVPYRSSIMPLGDGSFYLIVNKSLRETANAVRGDTVTVAMELDTAPREVDLPDDLRQAFERHPVAHARFIRLSFSHRQKYVDWILSAKQVATRERRIAQTIGDLAEMNTRRLIG